MVKSNAARVFRKRRSALVAFLAVLALVVQGTSLFTASEQLPAERTEVLAKVAENSKRAIDVLNTLQVKGRAPKTGYTRAQFGDGWADVGGCDVRNIIMGRSMTDVERGSDGCVVLSGVLDDPYTDTIINFRRGSSTSGAVQIDHVVALSDSWQKGAQLLDYDVRVRLANDPLNLLAVDGPANQQKGDADAASWLPPNKKYRCAYVARQIAVKSKYNLWVTDAEKSAMKRILNGCGEQVLPVEIE